MLPDHITLFDVLRAFVLTSFVFFAAPPLLLLVPPFYWWRWRARSRRRGRALERSRTDWLRAEYGHYDWFPDHLR